MAPNLFTEFGQRMSFHLTLSHKILSHVSHTHSPQLCSATALMGHIWKPAYNEHTFTHALIKLQGSRLLLHATTAPYHLKWEFLALDYPSSTLLQQKQLPKKIIRIDDSCTLSKQLINKTFEKSSSIDLYEIITVLHLPMWSRENLYKSMLISKVAPFTWRPSDLKSTLSSLNRKCQKFNSEG